MPRQPREKNTGIVFQRQSVILPEAESEVVRNHSGHFFPLVRATKYGLQKTMIVQYKQIRLAGQFKPPT